MFLNIQKCVPRVSKEKLKVHSIHSVFDKSMHVVQLYLHNRPSSYCFCSSNIIFPLHGHTDISQIYYFVVFVVGIQRTFENSSAISVIMKYIFYSRIPDKLVLTSIGSRTLFLIFNHILMECTFEATKVMIH